MSTQTDVGNLTYELLKRLNAKVDAIGFDLLDMKSRVVNIEEGLASASVRIAAVEVSIAGVGKRMDRVDDRLGRIERGLDLRDGDTVDA